MTTSSLLEQELTSLNAQIEKARGTLAELKCEKRAVDAELETFSADRQRFDALRDACNLLDRLDQLDAGRLFWGELPEIEDAPGRIARLRSHIARFDGEIGSVLQKQTQLKARIDQRLDALDCLYDQIDEAYDRDERRESEFAIVRELSLVPHPPALMPWSSNDESDRRYRFNLRSAMTLSFLLAIIIHLIVVPKAVRPIVAQIPERLAMMVREEPRRPAPAKKAGEKKEQKKEEKAGEKKVAKNEEKQQAAPTQAAPARPKAEPVEQTAAPRKSQNTGVLAFKEAFKDLLDETAVPRLGTESRLSNNANQAGHAVASRSLVTMQGGAGGGVGGGAFSRNVGSGGIGGAAVGRGIGGGGGGNGARIGSGGNGFAQVKSAIAATGPNDAGKPVNAGGRPGRTDEEIQLLFDRYKAALYRIYNTELRKDPTLRGKMVLRITIEPGGAVSACAVESCNMNAPGFSAQIVERVRKFNFGPKDGVPKMTILYPIDFLPTR